MSRIKKSKAKETDLIEKGMQLFWAHGYHGTSINDIVKLADVPKGSFYFYFDSKEDFAVKVVEKYFEEMILPAQEILSEKDKSAKERILKFFQSRVDYVKGSLECIMGCLGCNLGNEMSDHSESIRLAILNKENRLKLLLSDVMQQAQNEGEIRADIKVQDLVSFIQDAGKGAMISMKEMQDSYPLDNYMNLIKKILN